VLGALSDEERRAFESHLATCPACAHRVDAIADLPAILGTLSPEAFGGGAFADDDAADPGPVPDTLLPGLLRRAAVEHRRRRWFLGTVTGFAAACAIALAVVAWPSGTSAPAPPARAMSAVVASPVRASAALVDQPWGTQIRLVCRYAMTAAAGYLPYGLVVVDTQGNRHELGSWTLAPGGETDFTAGTALPHDRIASVQITVGTRTVLRLTP
jgi:hypothetical protein